MQRNDLTGVQFGRLTALTYLGNSRWRCVCECGKQHEADAYHLRAGKILSCGCLGRENRLAGLRAAMLPVNERFMNSVHVGDGDDCWLWTGQLFEAGYGKFCGPAPESKTLQAHRFSYELHRGPIPDGLMVCHTCDNPPCVRPDHLFLGTAKDNTQDAISKGRMAVGSANPRALVTEADVMLIRHKYSIAPLSSGGKKKKAGTIKRIAAAFGLSEGTVNDIIYGRSWTHV